MSDPDLFSYTPPAAYPERAGAKENTTSQEAADGIESKGRAARLRSDVLAWYAAGHRGTADDCAMALGESILAIRPRVTELKQQGKIVRTAERRRSEGGRMAWVMRAR